MSESKIEKLIKSNPDAVVQFNQRKMTRIYPKGVRVDSSNYDPGPMWSHGCNLVALNYQTHDLPMWLNHARFMINKRCGYILKPEYLRKLPDPITNPPAVQTVTFRF